MQADTFIKPKETTWNYFLFPGIRGAHSVPSVSNWIVLVHFQLGLAKETTGFQNTFEWTEWVMKSSL